MITDGELLAIYDFDQSGPGWRGYEVHGVFHYAALIQRLGLLGSAAQRLWRPAAQGPQAYAALRRRLTPRQGDYFLRRYEARWPRPVKPRPISIDISPELAEALSPWCDAGESVGRFALRVLAQVAQHGTPTALARMLDEAEGVCCSTFCDPL